MTTPGGELNFGERATPGESEYSWGTGMLPPLERAAVEDFFPSNYDRLVASRQTETTNPIANEEATFLKSPTHEHIDPKTGMPVAGDMREFATERVTEQGPSKASGQFKPLDTSTYTLGHEPDGQQDGAGRRWRESLPPNPVT